MTLANARWPGEAETFSIPSLQAIDTISGHYEWGALAESKVTFLTHCPSNKEFIARCHRMGVQCFPYISLSFGITQVAVPSPSLYPMVLKPPAPADVYQGINFGASAFWAINSSGARTTSVSSDGVGVTAAGPTNQPDSYSTCPNVDAYQQRMMSWVEALMKAGADGVFIDAIPDSLFPGPCLSPCYADQPGPQFQQFHHNHIFSYNPADLNAATAAQQKAFSLLLERVRDIVLRYGGKVLGNTGLKFQYKTNPGPLITTFQFEYLDPFIENGVLPFLDSDMMELFLDLSDSEDPATNQTVQHSWTGYWYPYIQAVLNVLSKPQFEGKQVLVIPPNPLVATQMGAVLPPGFTCTVRAYHFLTYVAARFAGFIRFVGPLGQDQFADLARIRLGRPATGMLTDAGSNLFYRIFENGMVVLNSHMTCSHLRVSGPVNPQEPNPPFPTTKFLDLTDPLGTSTTAAARLEIMDVSTTGGMLTIPQIKDVSTTAGMLTIPPLSGHVYLFGADTSYLLA
jgi:hypothetical protein